MQMQGKTRSIVSRFRNQFRHHPREKFDLKNDKRKMRTTGATGDNWNTTDKLVLIENPVIISDQNIQYVCII